MEDTNEELKKIQKRFLEEIREDALCHLRTWFYNLEDNTELKALQELVDDLVPGAFTVLVQRG